MRPFVEHRLHLETPVVAVDPVEREVRTADGRAFPYDLLLSTMPLNHLVERMEHVPDAVRHAAGRLESSGTHVVGIGLNRPALSSKNWIYFPEPDVPFYRVTYLSNYSDLITPEPDQTVFLTETSFSRHKPEDPATIVQRVIDGLVSVGLMEERDRDLIVSTWHHAPSMTYPVPTLARDEALGTVQPWLREQGISSRGRFGAWLYEVGNMDHSFMQGVDAVNHALSGEPEQVWIPRGEGSAGAGIR
jgi:UDP-galactopyranose mutase